MKFLTILFIVGFVFPSYGKAEQKTMDFDSTVERMIELRTELKVDEIIKEIDIKIEDKYDEVTVSKVSMSSLSLESTSEEMPGGALLPGLSVPIFGMLKFVANEVLGTFLSFEVTQIVQDQEHLQRSLKKARIKEGKLKKKLDKYLDKNIGKIYELKYLHAGALIQLLNEVKSGKDLDLEAVTSLNHLGSFISFKGKKNVTFCTITNYKNTKFSQRNFSSSSYDATFTPFDKSFPGATLSENSFSSKNITVKNVKRTKNDCTFKSDTLESNPRDKNIYKYSMSEIDRIIEHLTNVLAARVILENLDSIYTFSFGSIYYNQDSGAHPFSDLD